MRHVEGDGALMAHTANSPAPPLRIEATDPQGPVALALLREAAIDARALYPELHEPDAPWPTNPPLPQRGAYVIAWRGETAIGCGALRPIDDDIVEIRRMYVLRTARKAGVARAVLAHLEEVARGLGFVVLRLETGYRQQPAMALYESAGFKRIAPFGQYANDPTSVCFEKGIS